MENLAASESRIRDTDMAKEMTMFTRHQILSQAGTAMLAQANQASQGVLRCSSSDAGLRTVPRREVAEPPPAPGGHGRTT